MMPMIRQPSNVPASVPLPPAMDTPPTTHEAIASSSAPSPMVGWPEPRREMSRIPEQAESRPEITYTRHTVRRVLTPEYCAATMLPPTA